MKGCLHLSTIKSPLLTKSLQLNSSFTFITWVLTFCGLSVVSHIYTMIPITGELSRVFHVSTATAALASSIFSFCYAFGFLVFGPLSDRFGRKPVMVYGLVALTASTFVVGFAHTIGLLLVFRALQGFVAATFAPVALAYVFEVYPAEKRATTIAFISTGFLMAGIVGQIVSSWVSHILAWSYVFILFAAIHLVMFLFMLKLPYTPVKSSDTNLLAGWIRMFRVFRNSNLLKAYIITFTLLLSFVGMYASLSSYLSHNFGLTTTQLLGFRAVGIIGMVLSPLAGQLANRFGLKKMLISGVVCSVVGLLLERELPSITLIGVASVVFVAGVSIIVPTLINIVGIMGGQMREAAVALYTFILFLGASVGPLIATVGDFMTVSLLLAGALTISLLLSFTLNIESERR
jgi:YNFM family putative membrane transporter